MTITVIFDQGNPRTFDKAVDAQAHGDHVILRDKDGKEVFAGGPIVAIVQNGRRIEWPPR